MDGGATRYDIDPRTRDAFQPESFPWVDSIPNSEVFGDVDARSAAKLRFAAVYYHLNLARVDLESARRAGGDEMAALRHVERILVVRDALESEYAQIGLHAEPVVVSGRVVELRFADPPPLAPRVRHSVIAAVPLPPGVDAPDL